MRSRIIIRWLLAAALLTAIVGCSTQSPVEPVNSVSIINPNTVTMSSPPANQIKFSAHVATIDLDERLLTFDEVTYVLIVPEDCPIVQIVNGDVISLELADLEVGDWVKVCSFLQEDGTVTANKIVLCTGDVCDGYDLAFQDSIATIDYDAESFTVHERPETILIDDNTLIWGIKPGFLRETTPDSHPADTVFSFTDLQPDYILEIKADVIDETTLLAIRIKVLSCNLKPSIEFQ